MQISFSNTNFLGKPENYAIIDAYLSRSAQPGAEDFKWLKEHGVTDIINFRTMYRPDVNFDEESEAKKAGLKYHSIPSITDKPTEENIDLFLKKVEEIKKNNGKVHIHCKAGADRTGMYAFVYEMKNGIGNLSKNLAEWFVHGYHYKIYPELMEWTIRFIKKSKK